MTYRMLLVDDEVHAIEGIKADLDLKKLGIEKLFTAYNIRQAKEIFARETVDIMICDIEMPQGSGLELLAWVREHHPYTVAIFLTNHADFKYAREALKLGSLDYLLKPVLKADLENAVRKAQSVIDRNVEISRNSKAHQLWMKHHAFIMERFWLDIINHAVPSRPSAIRELAERHQIPITDHAVFLPILISVKRWNKSLTRRDEKILEYALKKSAEEMIVGGYGNGICFPLDRGMLLVILDTSRNHDGDDGNIAKICRLYIESCNRYFYCDLSCYIGRPVEAHFMADTVDRLKEQDRNNVAYFNQVFSNHDAERIVSSVPLQAWSTVSSLLKAGNQEAVLNELERLLDELVQARKMDAETLHRFNQDFTQVLYTFLNLKGIQAHQLFGDGESKRVSEKAGRSVADTLEWVRYAVRKAMHQADAVKKTDTIVQTVKQFIALNIDQELSRETIAEQVYLNPDYLSRIFKRETGYSISDYVLAERIKLAKELLSQTNIPISSIASSVGYGNFSHFSKIFKKYVGVGPTEYRNANNRGGKS